MWLKKLVAVSMVITLVGMNTIAIVGLFSPAETVVQPRVAVAPTIRLSASPTEVAAGSSGAITWSTTGDVTSCEASGDWSGPKTPFGAESTGRLSSEGSKTYILSCKNASGSVSQQVKLTVSKAEAVAATPSTPATPTSPQPQQAVYCGGSTPCYGPREVAAHSGAGNCWGYNANRVINVSSLDAGFHRSKSGISSIEVGGVCGGDLSGALGGSVAADGQRRSHNNSTKANADRNLMPYIVGYYDGAKP